MRDESISIDRLKPAVVSSPSVDQHESLLRDKCPSLDAQSTTQTTESSNEFESGPESPSLRNDVQRGPGKRKIKFAKHADYIYF